MLKWHSPGKMNPEQSTLSNRGGKKTFPSSPLYTTFIFLITLNIYFTFDTKCMFFSPYTH